VNDVGTAFVEQLKGEAKNRIFGMIVGSDDKEKSKYFVCSSKLIFDDFQKTLEHMRENRTDLLGKFSLFVFYFCFVLCFVLVWFCFV
jgi:hypothetical protein